MEIKPIRTKADHRAALKEIKTLMSARPGTPEGDRLDALAKLVEAWEEKRYPVAYTDEPLGKLRVVPDFLSAFQPIIRQMSSRYTPHGPEGEFQPGSRGRALRNVLGLRRVRDITLAESQALQLAQDEAIERYTVDHRFTAEDICDLHRSWLGAIYSWAGQYRTVNMGKGGFQFANAALIPNLMRDLERGPLAQFTPCLPRPDAQIANALAVVHAELVLIHPFREGNGRLTRLLAMLMALQAGLPPLDFTPMTGRGKSHYIAGIHAATGHDYRPLAAIFERIIELTWKRAASSGR